MNMKGWQALEQKETKATKFSRMRGRQDVAIR
jgi:hypothetical protein